MSLGKTVGVEFSELSWALKGTIFAMSVPALIPTVGSCAYINDHMAWLINEELKVQFFGCGRTKRKLKFSMKDEKTCILQWINQGLSVCTQQTNSLRVAHSQPIISNLFSWLQYTKPTLFQFSLKVCNDTCTTLNVSLFSYFSSPILSFFFAVFHKRHYNGLYRIGKEVALG